MNLLKGITYTLVLIGAINWGLIGAFNFNLVSFLFGDMSITSRIVYVLVGLCAIAYLLFSLKDNFKECSSCNY